MVTPIWKAAGLEPSSLHVYLVEDKQINSFVAGGQNEFINSGLIMRSQTPNQLIGVLAHETGHIAGGHLTRFQEAARNASIEGIIAMVLAAAFGTALARFATIPVPTMILATAPGGIGEMGITANVLKLGVPLVTAFHLTRIVLIVTMTAPLFSFARRAAVKIKNRRSPAE